MANEDADAISNQIIQQKGWNLAPLGKQRYLEQRLMAGFVWKRARDLLPTVGAAQLPATLTIELTAVQSVLNTLLGANRKSGTLLAPRAPGTSDTVEHLDLADLARQRVVTDPKPNRVSLRKAIALQARSTAVITIAWRAATLETNATTNPIWTNSTTLNIDALKEIIDRRLRAIERMQYNVSVRDIMMSENGTKFTFSQATTGWFDGLRVRLFEYMEMPLAIFSIPNLPVDEWDAGTGAYQVFPSSNRTLPDGTVVKAPAPNAWRFPDAVAPNFEVSVGDGGNFYRIDVLTAQSDPVAAIDGLFAYRELADGTSPKADMWNRAWLLCDHVISAIHLEALLFGLRRRQTASTGEATFRSLVSLRPTVTQAINDDPSETHAFDTAFVALDGYIRNSDEGSQGTPTVLMQSDVQSGPFVDRYFRNERITVNDLQIGDHVKFLNSPIYSLLTRNEGVWKLENAIVVGIEPTADDSANRTSVSLGSLRVQGHGTVVETYDSIRETLGKSLDRLLQRVFRQIRHAITIGDGIVLLGNQPRNTPPSQLTLETVRVFSWAPFPENSTLTFRVPSVQNNRVIVTVQTVQSAPWWIAVPLVTYGGDVAAALASVPHSIGKNDIASNSNIQPVPSLPEFRLKAGQGPLDKYILFPLFEPTIAPGANDRGPWGNYFEARAATPLAAELRSLDVAGDVSFIPGLYRQDPSTGGLRVFGTVRPNPRAQVVSP
jgi:hypothetical protein